MVYMCFIMPSGEISKSTKLIRNHLDRSLNRSGSSESFELVLPGHRSRLSNESIRVLKEAFDQEDSAHPRKLKEVYVRRLSHRTRLTYIPEEYSYSCRAWISYLFSYVGSLVVFLPWENSLWWQLLCISVRLFGLYHCQLLILGSCRLQIGQS